MTHVNLRTFTSSRKKNMSSQKPISVEQLLDRVNRRGLWQFLVLAQSFVPLCLFAILVYEQNYLLAGPMQHRCIANDARMIGERRNGGGDALAEIENECVEKSSGRQCHAWTYQSPHYTETIVSEFNLVCSNSLYVPIYKSLYIIGFMSGVPLWGVVSDRIGRRPVMCWLAPLQLLVAFGLAMSTQFWMIVVARLSTGFFACGYWNAAFVLNMELASPKRRNLIGILLNAQWMVAGIMAGVLGQLFSGSSWRTLHLYSAAAAVVAVPLTLLVPESPRWLVIKERYADALKVFGRAARVGGDARELPSDVAALRRMLDGAAPKKEKKSESVLSAIFLQPELRRRTLMLIFQWMAVVLVFYGVLYYATGGLGGGNPYWTLALQGALRLVVVYPLIMALDRFGKRPVMLVMLVATGLTLAGVAALPSGQEWATVAMLLQVGAIVFDDSALNSLYTFTSELYPTVLRQTGLGICSMSSRVGALASPFASDLLGAVWRPLPAILFGALAFLAAIMLLRLPEMNMRAMPDTLDDVDDEVTHTRNAENDEREGA